RHRPGRRALLHGRPLRLVPVDRRGAGSLMRLRLDPGVARLRSRSSTADLAAHLARAGWAVRVVDLNEVRDKAGILEAFERALSFPDWVGRNWDALDDALRDLSWWPPGERGRAIIVAGAGRLDDDLQREWAI